MKKSLIFLVVISLFLNSCATMYLYKDTNYNETFYSFFVSKRNDVVFLGDKYHYVFRDDSGQISEFTKPEWKDKLGIEKIVLTYDNDNNVMGYILLRADDLKELNKDQIAFLNKVGFKENYQGSLTKRMDLFGVRYEPAIGVNYYSAKYNLSKHYKVRIENKPGSGKKVARAALTPVTIAADGAFIILGGVWIPLGIIIYTYNKESKNKNYY